MAAFGGIFGFGLYLLSSTVGHEHSYAMRIVFHIEVIARLSRAASWLEEVSWPGSG